tara:strand:+ start:11200 stop:12048 length:849 start_codon:yes stop_codon:yes gene_type:complete
MNNIDLNLDNYELQDLLNLFNLSYNFDEAQLKSAKKIVLKTHPDKSKLPKEYFLFFSKAYKIIYSIYEFRVKGKGSTEYIVENENNEALKKIANNKNFNKIFNKLFEKYNIKDEESEKGYGEWLKSDDDINNVITTKENMNNTFNKMKETACNSIINNSYSELESKNYKDLLGNAPETYSADIFSSLAYEDLRKAHIENVVPVSGTNSDTFNSIEELRLHRNKQNIKPTSMIESKKILDTKKNNEIKTDVERAYKLAKQDEIYKDMNNNVLSNFYKLTNTNY